MFAIIEEAGKQFKVTSGDVINISRDITEDTFTFERVLLVGGEGAAKVGTPVVAGATVTATVLGAILTKKTESVKYKRRKGFHKTIGHRQQYTQVKITGITA